MMPLLIHRTSTRRVLLAWGLAILANGSIQANPEVPWEAVPNQVFSVVDGVGLLLDVFKPKSEPNGLGAIVVNSGGWYCGRAVYEAYLKGELFQTLSQRGYTVFFISPGARPRFSGEEMVSNLNIGIRWVKLHAQDYSIDPDKLGMIGASSGGHLALMAAVSARDASPESAAPLDRFSSRVAALGVFCPPTDMVSWNGEPEGYKVLADLFAGCSRGSVSEEDLLQRAERISPVREIRAPIPPLLLIHGDADPLVPLSHSERMVEAIKRVGGEVELLVKQGGGHSWPTVSEEFRYTVDWLDRRLRPEAH